MLHSNENMGPTGGVIQTVEPAGVALSATSVPQILYMAPEMQRARVAEIRTIFGTASTSGTVQVEVLTGTQALGSGTAVTGNIPLTGAVNTTVRTASTSPFLILNAGDRVAIRLGGTLTGLANAFVQVTLHRHRT